MKFPVQEEISEISTRIKSSEAEIKLNQDLNNKYKDEKHHSDDENPDKSIYYSDYSDDEDTNNAPLRHSERTTRGIPPKHLINEMNIVYNDIKEPKSYNEAVSSPFKDQWIKAMQEEMASLEDNQTWELLELPHDRQAIGCKWIYKMKRGEDGSIRRFKARLVAQGYSQKFGEDYDQVFAPVVKHSTFRVLLALAARRNMEVYHMDAKTAFLNGTIDEVIFMKQPPGFVAVDKSKLVCRLKKSLYGLKQSARSWNQTLHATFLSSGFLQGMADPCFYRKKFEDDWSYILIYVDDIIIASRKHELITKVESTLKLKFKIENLGPIKEYFELEISKDVDGLYNISQSRYIKQVIADFSLSEAKISEVPMNNNYEKDNNEFEILPDAEKYRKLIGCLLYISVISRPDISASVSILAQKISRPTQRHWNELKRIVRYLKGTIDFKLKLGNINVDAPLIGYADANWADCKLNWKSNSGHIFFVFGAAISWCCRKQPCVALSSTEAEYISLCEAGQEAIWLRRLLNEFDIDMKTPTVIYEDNQSCLKFSEEERLSNRTKHIDTKRYFIRDHVKKGEISCLYCPSEDMIADLLTKPLGAARLKKLRESCGLYICNN